MAVYDFFSSIHFYDLHPVDRMSTNKKIISVDIHMYLVRFLYDMMRMLI